MPIRMEDAAIYHHGIKGQKWGVRNGPPYPLDAATSAKVKAGAKSEVGHVAGVEDAALAAYRERQERLSRNPAWAQAKKEVDAKKDVVKEKAGRYNDELAGSVLKSLGIEDSKEMRDFVCREGLLYDDD